MFAAKMMLVATGLAAAALASAPTTAPDDSSPALARLTRQLVRDGAPGALVLVRTPSGTEHAVTGVARRRPRVPLAIGDRFRVASLTKTFVATVVLQLADEGRLRLDDPVDRWLPGLLPHGDAITIRQLLDHTSGLFDYLDDRRFVRALIAKPGRFRAPRTLVGIATRHAPLFAPGRGWHYSNTNYIVLGLVIEAVTRSSVAVQLEQRIFEPLHLARTSFPTTAAIGGPHAHGYISFASVPRLHSLYDATAVESPSVAWTAGAIVSTAEDVTSFYAALVGGRLLPPPLLREMETPAPGSSYGLGLQQVETSCGRVYGHIGAGVGYRTVVYARPDGDHVAVAMINIDETYVPQSELEATAEATACSTK
jgi:D-alanyl-D-alanine carboxypeptidase